MIYEDLQIIDKTLSIVYIYSSCGGKQRDEAAEVRGDIEFAVYRCVLS